LGVVGFAGLARALGVSEEQALEAMPVATADDLAALVEVVASSAGDGAHRRLLALIFGDTEVALELARPLGPRRAPAGRRALLPRALQRDSDGLATTVALMGRQLGEAPLAALRAAPGFEDLTRMVKAAVTGTEESRGPDAARELDTL